MQTLPDELPVMTLPNTVFFPKTVLPLHIFEPRYRQMVQEVLETHRTFAVTRLATRSPDGLAEREPPNLVATVGIIGACQKNEDGTSELLLVGLARVAITEIVREVPYRVIRVRALPDSTSAPADNLERLKRTLLRTFDFREKLGIHLPSELTRAMREIEDPAALCDLLVFTLEGDPTFKQSMLETLDPAIRLQRAIIHFRRGTEALRLQRRLQGPLSDEDIANN